MHGKLPRVANPTTRSSEYTASKSFSTGSQAACAKKGRRVTHPNDASDFERFPTGQPTDETDISLRAYVSRLPADHLSQYRSDWTDEQVMVWDGNFRSD